MGKYYVGRTEHGMATYLHTDFDGDKALLETEQDVQPLLEQNARKRNDGTGGWTEDRTMMEVADIPAIIWDRWHRQYGAELYNPRSKLLWRLLNDPDNRYFRTDK